jgi:hypothetical protein
MPSSAIHVLWLCRKPWGVSPSLTGSQQARGAPAAGCCPPPGQDSFFVLWVTIVPSRRNLTACLQDGQCPVPPVPTRRGVPLPDGGVKGLPGTAGDHDATGLPGAWITAGLYTPCTQNRIRCCRGITIRASPRRPRVPRW